MNDYDDFLEETGVTEAYVRSVSEDMSDHIDLLVNSEPQTQLTQFVSKHPGGLQSVGNSALPITFTPPKTIPGPAIVKLQAISGTSSISVSGWFNGYVVTNGF